jgi:NAD(P)-dependent dehydrogenase (short-subunit alcohol dehydrogenase family)
MQIESGQVAVITGGASGIGFGLARAFVDRGLGVAIADVDPSTLGLAVDQLTTSGANVIGVQTDVRDGTQLDRLRDETLDRLGRVDIICNNAGVIASPMRPLWEFTLDEWYWVLDINLRGVIHGLRSFVPHLVSQGHGHIVNTSSLAGLATVAGIAPYTASKRAVVGLSETLHDELADRAPNVGVTVLCPARVASRLGESSELTRPGADPDAAAAATSPSEIPTPERGVISAEENAAAVLEAIEAGTLHIAPGHGAVPLVEKRVGLLRQSLGF